MSKKRRRKPTETEMRIAMMEDQSLARIDADYDGLCEVAASRESFLEFMRVHFGPKGKWKPGQYSDAVHILHVSLCLALLGCHKVSRGK